MELKVTTLEGKEAGSRRRCPTLFSGSSRAPTSSIAASYWQLAKRQRRHPQGEEPRRHLAHRQENVRQKGTGSAPPRLGARARCSAAAAARSARVVRSHAHRPAEEGARARAQACALGQGQGRRHHRHRGADAEGSGKTKALRGQFDKLGLANALIIDGAEVAADVRTAARNIPNIDVLPVAGHQRLRHHAAAEAGADQGRGRCAGGALQMTTTDPRHYDVILAPVITEKATKASEHNKVDVQGRA